MHENHSHITKQLPETPSTSSQNKQGTLEIYKKSHGLNSPAKVFPNKNSWHQRHVVTVQPRAGIDPTNSFSLMKSVGQGQLHSPNKSFLGNPITPYSFLCPSNPTTSLRKYFYT